MAILNNLTKHNTLLTRSTLKKTFSLFQLKSRIWHKEAVVVAPASSNLPNLSFEKEQVFKEIKDLLENF